MVRPEKKEAVAEIKDKIGQSKSMVIADYLGLDVAEMTELRSQLRDQGVEFKVVKNTLASIAADESDMEEMKEFFTGPTAIAFGMEDAVSPGETVRCDGTAVGEVTTVADSPRHGDVALGYVDAEPGDTVEIDGVDGEVREPPLEER